MGQISEFIFSHKRELFELIKLAAGSFLGFGLALLSARLFDYQKRRREHLVAGSLALFTLKNQYNDFLLFRRDFRENIARPELTGKEPIWALMQPTFLQIDDSKIDFNAIGFLFESGKNATTIDALQHSQILHRDLLALHGKRNESVARPQEVAAKISADKKDHILANAQKEAGPALISLVTALTRSLSDRASRNEEKYRKAYDDLWFVLTASRKRWWERKMLGAKFVSPFLRLDEAKAGYKIEDLPGLPNSLQLVLNDGKNPAIATSK